MMSTFIHYYLPLAVFSTSQTVLVSFSLPNLSDIRDLRGLTIFRRVSAIFARETICVSVTSCLLFGTPSPFRKVVYGKCPKISNTKLSDKMTGAV